MKHWIKRSLFGLFGGALVVGSLAGCAGQRHGWGSSERTRAEFRARMVERVGSKLDLDAAQKQKLTVLADKLQAQRAACAARRRAIRARSSRRCSPAPSSTRRGAAKLIDEKTAAVRSPAARKSSPPRPTSSTT